MVDRISEISTFIVALFIGAGAFLGFFSTLIKNAKTIGEFVQEHILKRPKPEALPEIYVDKPRNIRSRKVFVSSGTRVMVIALCCLLITGASVAYAIANFDSFLRAVSELHQQRKSKVETKENPPFSPSNRELTPIAPPKPVTAPSVPTHEQANAAQGASDSGKLEPPPQPAYFATPQGQKALIYIAELLVRQIKDGDWKAYATLTRETSSTPPTIGLFTTWQEDRLGVGRLTRVYPPYLDSFAAVPLSQPNQAGVLVRADTTTGHYVHFLVISDENFAMVTTSMVHMPTRPGEIPAPSGAPISASIASLFKIPYISAEPRAPSDATPNAGSSQPSPIPADQSSIPAGKSPSQLPNPAPLAPPTSESAGKAPSNVKIKVTP